MNAKKCGVSMQRILLCLAVLTVASASVFADGMIVPVRPQHRVRGHWAVKYHHVRITVRDQVASVAIDQAFVNTGSGMIEVEYLFPVPPGAAIDSMTLLVDGKEYAAKLLRAEEARRIYESIVRQKKDPALLEYAGFGLYKTRAFPLRAGKPCKVLVTYKNVCKKDRDLVEVWYPLNTEKFSAKPIEDIEVRVDIKSKSDITAVYSPTHDLTVKRKDPRQVIATYQAKGSLPTKDFQVFYKAGNEQVGGVLLTHQPDVKKDGYFMMLASPNPRSAKTKIVPKDMVVVLDHSGSMSGKKIDQAKEAVRFVLGNLNKQDRFNVVAYNDSIELFSDKLMSADKKNVAKALDRLDRVEATGGTNIHEALEQAMKLCRADKKSKRPAYVIFLTDGRPTVGKTDEREILTATKKLNAGRSRVFAFGVGYDVNVRLLDKLAGDNRGKSDYVKPNEPIESKVSSLYAKIKNPVMTNLKVSVGGLRLRDQYPREVGDLFDGDQIILVGRYDASDVKKLKLADKKRHSTLVIKGRYQGKERAFEYPVTINTGGKDAMFAFVEKLWAIRRVGFLLDQIQLHGKSKEIVDELVRLSMKYGIMTPYTSFLADEGTRLADSGRVRRMALEATASLAAKSGAEGHRGAANRRSLNQAVRAPSADGAGYGRSGGVAMHGWGKKDSYEKGKREYVPGVRQVGRKSLYRRGRTWVTGEVAQQKLGKDDPKAKVVHRFSKEYFDLVRGNTVSENQVMASQRDNEELMIELRGQVYRIK